MRAATTVRRGARSIAVCALAATAVVTGSSAAWASSPSGPVPHPPVARDSAIGTSGPGATGPTQTCYNNPSSDVQPGEQLAAGQSRTSLNGAYRLVEQSDGNLVAYTRGGKAVWASGTSGHAGAHLAMQGDGNAVIYDTAGKAVWASNTWGVSSAFLRINEGGAVTVDGCYADPQWRNGAPSSQYLPAGQTLSAGQSLYSQQDTVRITMQGDGNLVEYAADGRVLWATGTSGTGVHLTMQTDGNAVIYNSIGKALWASNTSGHTGQDFAVNDDGSVILLDTSGMYYWSHTVPYRGVLASGQQLTVDEQLWSAVDGGNYGFSLNADGTMDVTDATGYTTVWSTATAGAGGNHLVMQGDGNLVLYTPDNKAVWASNTPGHTGGHLVMQQDSNLVLYDGAGKAYWAIH